MTHSKERKKARAQTGPCDNYVGQTNTNSTTKVFCELCGWNLEEHSVPTRREIIKAISSSPNLAQHFDSLENVPYEGNDI